MQGMRTMVVGTTALLVLGSACSDDKTDGTSSAPAIRATLSEFSVGLTTPTVAAGDYTLEAKNVGGAVHELVVMRASAADVKTNADGEADEESVPEVDHLGEVEDVAPGGSKSLSVTLTPGHYIVFCNLAAAEGVHYLKGMHAEFDVT